jgi:hypothetical protein
MTPPLLRWLWPWHRDRDERADQPAPPPKPPAPTTPPTADAAAGEASHRPHLKRSHPEEWAFSEPGDDDGLEAMLPEPDDGF